VSSLTARVARLEQEHAGCAVCKGQTPIALLLSGEDAGALPEGRRPCRSCGRGVVLRLTPYERPTEVPA
jgi:hypothetical protein